MGRISKVTTRTGDKGQTGLGDGSRVSKSHSLIYQLGEIDELNSHLGYAITCLLYTSPSPRDRTRSRMPSSA